MPTEQKCNPVNPGTEKVYITIAVSAVGNSIAITAIDKACQEARSRTYHVTAEDDDTFLLPDDLHPATLAMLSGVSRRFMQLARHGFDREP